MNFACLAGLYNFGRLDTLPIIKHSGAFEAVPLFSAGAVKGCM
jgi:hypothetical protein